MQTGYTETVRRHRGSADELAGLASPDAIWSEGMRFAAGAGASSVEQWIDDLGV